MHQHRTPAQPARPRPSWHHIQKAKFWFYSCSSAPTFEKALAKCRRRYPSTAAGAEFEAWAREVYRKEKQDAIQK